ncbi:MAG: hypothetical protein H6742_19785 [Alphaproteobacteria bacterium]|nr:hypothetical protein [Alphaproteobacteria bacterium]
MIALQALPLWGAALLLAGPAWAGGPEVWAALHDARLTESADRDPANAVAIYETLLHHLPTDDELEAELLLQLARARFDDGSLDGAREALEKAGSDPGVGARARAWRVQLDAWEQRVQATPAEDARAALVLGWSAAPDAALTADDDGLTWVTDVRDGRDDFLLAAIDAAAAPFDRLVLHLRADDFPAHLRVIAEDAHGQRWATPVTLVRPGAETKLELELADLLPAAALARDDRVDPADVRLLMLQDVTAFHGSDRGENRVRIDVLSLR